MKRIEVISTKDEFVVKVIYAEDDTTCYRYSRYDNFKATNTGYTKQQRHCMNTHYKAWLKGILKLDCKKCKYKFYCVTHEE